ncbi:MAG: alpha/beta fold hydrolase [Pseudomonadota bacterium]
MDNIRKMHDNHLPPWIANQIPDFVKSGFVETSRGRMHFLSGGLGQKVLMVHGNPTWSFLWRKVIAHLGPEKFECFAPDLFNLGFSDSLKKQEFSMEMQSRLLLEFIDRLKLKDFILVVQDWGGPIGLYAASQIPEKVKALVILNTGISAPEPPYKVSKFHSFVKKKILPDLVFRWGGFPLYSLHKTQGDSRSIRKDVARAYRYPIRRKNRWDSALRFARMVPSHKNDPALPLLRIVESYCASFQGPVRVVWGLKDPILGRSLKHVRRIFSEAQVRETQSGHFLQEECPDIIADAISQVTH